MNHESKILIIGAGSSSNILIKGISEELYEEGFLNITNIDFSQSVISVMKEKHKEKEPNF